MKPEQFIFISCVLALIVGLLGTILSKLDGIHKLLAAKAEEGERDG